jgi:acetamidase/formamidase
MGDAAARVRAALHHRAAPFGGNLDCRELIAGSTLFLPIGVDGGLLSVGDGHGPPGDGEVAGTAIECPMDGLTCPSGSVTISRSKGRSP